MRNIMIVILILLLFSNLGAKDRADFLNPYISQPSLVNFSKISLSHSASFRAGFNSDNYGFYQSMYTSHINYKFSPKLDFNLDLNFVNYGTTTQSGIFDIETNGDNQSRVLPEFSLHYTPSENTSIMIEFRQVNPLDYRFKRW